MDQEIKRLEQRLEELFTLRINCSRQSEYRGLFLETAAIEERLLELREISKSR